MLLFLLLLVLEYQCSIAALLCTLPRLKCIGITYSNSVILHYISIILLSLKQFWITLTALPFTRLVFEFEDGSRRYTIRIRDFLVFLIVIVSLTLPDLRTI